MAFSVTQADIVSFQTANGVRRAVRTDGALDRGNSGGPALTLEGEVAGVVTEMEANSGGLQIVALLYTADALTGEVNAILASPSSVEAACDAGPEVLPEEWADDYQDVPAHTEAYAYGDDPLFDELQDSCAAGDMYACDQLYEGSPVDSMYEAYGSTCGERTDPRTGSCVDWEAESEGMPEAEDGSYGPPVDLAGLRAACATGDYGACDSLFFESPGESEEEGFGATCGGRAEYERGTCVARAGTF